MSAEATHAGGERLRFDAGRTLDLSIPLRFDGAQPNHFGARPASDAPMTSGDFVGDTRRGGSCNAVEVTLNPHCNGTHTECVGHVTDERTSVTELVRDVLCRAQLITVTPATAKAGDRIIDVAELEAAVRALPAGTRALVVRTLPNGEGKRQRAYRDSSDSPWYTTEAAQWLVDRGIEHWLTDTPSIDRLHDGGKLAAHRVFWGLAADSRRLADAARPHATITEMIFVPDSIADGAYALNLQLAPFALDATPSRPLLYPLLENNMP
ncbi:MAG: cyclase family protein [Pseudomonadota bacterium]